MTMSKPMSAMMRMRSHLRDLPQRGRSAPRLSSRRPMVKQLEHYLYHHRIARKRASARSERLNRPYWRD